MALTLNCSVGSLLFHGWSGRLAPLQNQGEDFARLGQTSSGSQVTNVRAAPSRVEVWRLFDTVANAITYAGSCEALQWTVIRTADPLNGTVARVRVQAVSCTVTAGRGGDGTTRYGALLRVSLTMEVLL